MSYSRRQLYAMGEPLGESATYRKVDGGLVLGGGGGGGGSAPANTTSTTTQTADLPDWAKGYAKDTLAKTAALTDINQNPYQTYNQPRIAGFSPLQQQAQQGAADMTTAGQLGTGTNLATAAGIGGLGIAAQANPQNFQNQVGGYMNPYMQQVLNPQLDELRRQYGISGTQQAGQATQAGAFGGSRDAIMAAENQRNLGTAQNQAIGSAYNQAFNAAQNQYNQGQNQSLQGLGLAGQQASNLGQLGQTQYGQQMGINQLQNQYGGQQQALQQQGLTQGYQDFINQQNYPYKQLGFMSDMIRGLPLGQQSTASVYAPPPSALQTMGALGLGAYGAQQLGMFANGGQVQSYDEGGVTSENNTIAIINKMTDPKQLQLARQNAQARSDDIAVAAIDKRLTDLAASASMSKGIAGAMPYQMTDGMASAANGGIMHFAKAGEVDSEEDDSTESGTTNTGTTTGSPGNPYYYGQSLGQLMNVGKQIGDFKGESYTPGQQQELTRQYYQQEQNIAGPSPYGDLETDQQQRESDRLQALEQGKGAIALKGMQALLQGGNAIRGFGNLAGTVGEESIKMQQADRAEKRAIANMNFNIKKAKRDESVGMFKSAQGSTQKAIENQNERNKQALKQLEAQSSAYGKAAQASKPTGRAGAGGAGKKDKLAEQLAAAEIAFEKDPSDENTKNVAALRRAMAQSKTTDVGSTKADLARMQILSTENAKVQTAMGKFEWAPRYLEAQAEGPEKAKAVWNEELQRQRSMYPTPSPSGVPSPGPVGGGGSGGNAPPPPPGFNRQ